MLKFPLSSLADPLLQLSRTCCWRSRTAWSATARSGPATGCRSRCCRARAGISRVRGCKSPAPPPGMRPRGGESPPRPTRVRGPAWAAPRPASDPAAGAPESVPNHRHSLPLPPLPDTCSSYIIDDGPNSRIPFYSPLHSQDRTRFCFISFLALPRVRPAALRGGRGRAGGRGRLRLLLCVMVQACTRIFGRAEEPTRASPGRSPGALRRRGAAASRRVPPPPLIS